MSLCNVEAIAHSLTQGCYLAESAFNPVPGAHRNYVEGVLARLASADPVAEIAAMMATREKLSAQYAIYTKNYTSSAAPDEKPFAYANGMAIIPIHGMLLNRMPYSFSFATGYNFVSSQLAAAMDDDDVEMIVYDYDTYGGMAAGCEELSLEIFNARAGKPSVAVVDSNCFSAGYYLASAASKIFSTPSGSVGSIGVVLGRPDFSEALKEMGIKVTMFHAGANKLDYSPMVPLTDKAKERIQSSVDDAYELFTNAVARGRESMTAAAARKTEASIYSAPDAVKAGLIDGVAVPSDAVQQAITTFFNSSPDSPEDEDDEDDDSENDATHGARNMALRPEKTAAATTTAAVADPAAIAEAVQTAMRADRERRNGITTCAEAEGRTKLASHLALNTEMTVAEAQAILAASPKEAAATADANALAAAMAGQGTPGVKPGSGASGQGGKEGGSGAEDSHEGALAVLRAQDKACGTNYAEAYMKKNGMKAAA